MTIEDVLKGIAAGQHPAKFRTTLDIKLSDADAVGCKLILDLADKGYTVGEVLKILDAARWWTILWSSLQRDERKE